MERNKIQWYLLILVVFAYVSLIILSPEKGYQAITAVRELLIRIIPIIALVIVLMIIFDYFLPPEAFLKYIGRGSEIQGWIIAILAGLISSGPAYVWYPLLGRLMDEGARPGLIAAFLYARAVKIPLLPLMIYYFGLSYVAVLTGIMILASIVIGLVMELIMRETS